MSQSELKQSTNQLTEAPTQMTSFGSEMDTGSVVEDNALVVLGVVTAKGLQGIFFLHLTAEIGLGLADLFHFVPSHLTLVRCLVSLAHLRSFHHFLLDHLR